MILREYIKNPLGKGDSSLPGRELVIRSLEDKYFALDRKKGKLIKEKVYYDPTNGDFYIHLIIPTETERDNSYDVVVRFFDPTKTRLAILDYEVQLFTNAPSFAYTFSYVYNQYNLTIPFLMTKLGKVFAKKAPVVRNQFEIVGYDKYLFFGSKYLLDSKILNRAILTARAVKFSKVSLLKQVRSLDTIMKEYDIAAGKLKREKNHIKNEQTKANQKSKRTSVGNNTSIAMSRDGVVSTKRPVKPHNTVRPVKPIKTASGNRLRKK